MKAFTRYLRGDSIIDFNLYEVSIDEFKKALLQVLECDDVDQLKLYWLDIGPSDDDPSTMHAEAHLYKITHVNEHNKVETVLFIDDQGYSDERAALNQGFYDELSGKLFEEGTKSKFSGVYLQSCSQLNEYESASKDEMFLCGIPTRGKYILA